MVLDMRQLVRDHAGEFFTVQHLQQAGRHRHRGVMGIAPGRERVGLRIIHQIDLRHRQLRAARKLGHHPEQFRRAALIDLLGTVHRQHHAVRVPVGKHICRGGDHQRHHGAARSADQIADPHEQGRQPGKQNRSFEITHFLLPTGRFAGDILSTIINGEDEWPPSRWGPAAARRASCP